nr:GNAT family N-acetyltransferase [Cellulosimicrobium composti]
MASSRPTFEAERERHPHIEWVLPADVWLGVEDGGALVGAVHLAVPVGQALDIASKPGHPMGADPARFAKYLRRCAFVDEIAVRETHRRQGIALALLEAAERRGVEDTDRELHSIAAYAGSEAAVALFRRAGYSCAPPGAPVPREYANGLITYFDPRYQALGGSYVYKHTEKFPGDWRL